MCLRSFDFFSKVFFSVFILFFSLFTQVRGTHARIHPQLGRRGSRCRAKWVGHVSQVFFSCVHRAGKRAGHSSLSNYISSRVWGTVIWGCLRDSNMEKNVPRVLLQWFDSSETLSTSLHQCWDWPNYPSSSTGPGTCFKV